MTDQSENLPIDIFVIGGGVNGCGIARDAAGRGLTVTLAEMDDLAQATSSASSKLFHGGLRYLEYFEFGLVRHSLAEREVLLRAMPHISWPMRFVLPYHKDMRYEGGTPTAKLLTFFMPWLKGRRPAWLIRLGLFLYDNLGGRKVLPRTRALNLWTATVGEALQNKYEHAYEYSDCWVQDARLVTLNAVDAAQRGANILTRTKVTDAIRHENHWEIQTENTRTGEKHTHRATTIINAAGPWVASVLKGVVNVQTQEDVRLVRGSHIVVPKLFEHNQPYILQGTDGRIVFAIPYEGEFTLIGTTDVDHDADPTAPVCSIEEQGYLCEFVSKYFREPVALSDIVWSYSGVRPLYDDGASSAQAATRDYVLSLDSMGAPILSVFGGKITTYRKLAEDVLAKLDVGAPWTAGVPLPGGEFPYDGAATLTQRLISEHPYLTQSWANRLIYTYGTCAFTMLEKSQSADDLGRDFGSNLTETELLWLINNEFAQTSEDVLWRRTKLGLKLSKMQANEVEIWMTSKMETTE